MIVLDTTVLVYAVGDEHPLRSPCRQVIELAESGKLVATTTVEVIQEFVHVRARRRSRADAAALGADLATLLSPLLRPDGNDLRRALELFERTEALGAFDAVLATTALHVGADALVSADRGFATVSDLRHLDPGDPNFIGALSAGGR